MSAKKQYIQDALTLSHQIPLFDYNVNFQGLKKLLQTFNVTLNQQKDAIQKLQVMVLTKAERNYVDDNFAILNGALSLSNNTIDQLFQNTKNNNRSKPSGIMPELAFKAEIVSAAVNKLMGKSDELQGNINKLETRMSDNLKNQGRRLRQKIDGLDEATSKNLENYFKDANANFVRLQGLIKNSEAANAGKLGDAFALIEKKISMETLDAKLSGIQGRVESNVRRLIDADIVKRANMINEVTMKLKEHEGHSDDKFMAVSNKIQELSNRLSKTLQVPSFEKQKTRIYERFSEFKGRIEDLSKKSEDYMDYKKAQIIIAEKSKQEVMGMLDDIQKLKEKNQMTGSLLNATALLEKLDPHKICELDATATRHTGQIAKIQKQLLDFAQDMEMKRGGDFGKVTVTPGPKSGLGSEEVKKFIKDYLQNLDLQSNIRKLERQIVDLKKNNDLVNQLEKKFFAHVKEFDFGAVTKELRRKCNEEETRKDNKILGGRVDQLHEFIKLLRKDLDVVVEFMKRNEYKTSDIGDNAILTGKKLYPMNCISCHPSSKKVGGSSYGGYLNRTVRTPKPDQSIEVAEWGKEEPDFNRRISISAYKRK